MARVGRPPLYNNCLDLDAMCELYFETCDEGEVVQVVTKKDGLVRFVRQIPYTIPGLAYFLGFEDKDGFADQAKRRDEDNAGFSRAVKRARSRVEAQRARQLIDGDGNPAGKIFDLKNNFGWTDKHEVSTDSSITIRWGNQGDDGLPGNED